MKCVVKGTLQPLYPQGIAGTHCRGGPVGPRAGLEKCGKSRLHRYAIREPSSPQRLVISTSLSRSTTSGIMNCFYKTYLNTFVALIKLETTPHLYRIKFSSAANF